MADAFARLDAPKDPNYSMHCYDCRKGIDYNTGEYKKGRMYCRGCLCESCNSPYDRAKRTTVTGRTTGHKITICPKCFCAKCKVAIINMPFAAIAGTNGAKACQKCGCEVCNAAVFTQMVDNKKHCGSCLCASCSKSLASGYVVVDNYKYCEMCKHNPSPKTYQQPRQNVQPAPLVEKCLKCRRDIGESEEVLKFEGKTYHDTCFTCSQCRNPFGSQGQIFVKNQNYFCQTCVAGVCKRCNRPIGTTPCFTIRDENYHEQCFNCFKCNVNMPDGTCVIVNNEPHCKKCSATKQQAPVAPKGTGEVCWTCKQPLRGDQTGIAQLSHKYHERCFNCAHCSGNLSKEGTQVFVNADQPFCYDCMVYLSNQ